MNCSVCGNEILDGEKFCGNCGTEVKREIFCSNCGNKLMPEQKFCTQCGTPAEREDLRSKDARKKGAKKRKKQSGANGRFKSKTVTKALEEVPGNVIDKRKRADIAKIISMYALGAAASGAATAWLPGAGAGIAAVGQAAFIWTMYVRISECLGIKLSKSKLKFLSSAILSNLAISGGTLLAASAVSLIPGIGSVTSVLLMTGAGYAMVTVAGIMYIDLMSSLINEGVDVSAMSDEELKERMEKVMDGQNVKEMMKEAQGEYIKARKAGTVSGDETVELEKE